MPTSDIQFIAQMLVKIRAGDQITSDEDVRLRTTARVGAYDEPIPAEVPLGMTAEEFASATRAQPSLERG